MLCCVVLYYSGVVVLLWCRPVVGESSSWFCASLAEFMDVGAAAAVLVVCVAEDFVAFLFDNMTLKFLSFVCIVVVLEYCLSFSLLS